MSYPVLEFTIEKLAKIVIEANGKIGDRLDEYERRMPGVAHHVKYGFSHAGKLRMSVDRFVNGNKVVETIYPEQEVQGEIKFRPVIFEQPNYFFSVEIDPDVQGIKEDSIEIWHYLEDFKSHFTRRGRTLFGQYSFNTEPGQFRFEVRYVQSGMQRAIWVEFVVAATKMDVQTDYRDILRDVEEWDRSQLFVDNAKTVHDVAKFGQASKDEAKSWVVYFDAALDHYEEALKHILYQPHQRMIEDTRYRRAEQVKNWNTSLVREYARLKCDRSRLERHRFGEEVRETTFDTTENRFVKYTIKGLADLLRLAAGSFEDGKYDESFVKGVKVRQERMRRYLHEPALQRVGEFRGVGNSLVLQMRPGYSDIRIVWEKMTSLFSTDITLGRSAAVGLMRISALYEFWCFIALKKILDKVISESSNVGGNVIIPDKNSVDYRKAASLALAKEDDFQAQDAIVYEYMKKVPGLPGVKIADLIFQQTYDKGHGDDESAYSAPYSQRPDIVIRLYDKKRTYTYIFDAKYQVDDKDDKDVVPKESLDKMHCYRDAILWRKMLQNGQRNEYSHEVVGAYILYPADETKASYPADYDTYIEEQNIGAFPLLPGKTSKFEAFIRKVVDHIDFGADKPKWLKGDAIPQKGLFYTEDEEFAIDDLMILDVQVDEKKVAERAVANDLLQYPVKVSDIPAGKNAQTIKRLRLHIVGEAPRLLAVEWKGVRPATVVAGLFSAVPHASMIFNEGSYNIFEVKTG